MSRDLGNKYTCFQCGTKFYDLKKTVPICPKCGADQREAAVARLERKSKPAAESEADDTLDEDLAEDDALDDEDE